MYYEVASKEHILNKANGKDEHYKITQKGYK